MTPNSSREGPASPGTTPGNPMTPNSSREGPASRGLNPGGPMIQEVNRTGRQGLELEMPPSYPLNSSGRRIRRRITAPQKPAPRGVKAPGRAPAAKTVLQRNRKILANAGADATAIANPMRTLQIKQGEALGEGCPAPRPCLATYSYPADLGGRDASRAASFLDGSQPGSRPLDPAQ